MTKEQGFLRITHNILYINNLHKDIQNRLQNDNTIKPFPTYNKAHITV